MYLTADLKALWEVMGAKYCCYCTCPPEENTKNKSFAKDYHNNESYLRGLDDAMVLVKAVGKRCGFGVTLTYVGLENVVFCSLHMEMRITEKLLRLLAENAYGISSMQGMNIDVIITYHTQPRHSSRSSEKHVRCLFSLSSNNNTQALLSGMIRRFVCHSSLDGSVREC